jgi:hypothetical protein
VKRPSEPDEEQYDENGVDRTLVRHTLAMTPLERVRTHDSLLRDIERLAHAGRVVRDGRT